MIRDNEFLILENICYFLILENHFVILDIRCSNIIQSFSNIRK